MPKLHEKTNENSPQQSETQDLPPEPQTSDFSFETALNAAKNRKKRVKSLILLLAVCYFELILTVAFKLSFIINSAGFQIVYTYFLYYLMIGIVAGACVLEGKHIKTLGFNNEKLPLQIVIGAAAAVILAFFLGALPILIGGPGASTIGGKVTSSGEAIYQIITCLIFVGTVEELLFRGFIQTQLGTLIGGNFSKIACVLITATLFGLWHIINGFWLQVVFATGFGCIMGLMRAYMKNCSLLSVIIAHGMYDALLIVTRLILL